MGMDELEDAKAAAEGEDKAAQPAQTPAAGEEEDRGQRVDAAKAFFRAMYAGGEPPADNTFGQSETSTQTACRNCEALSSSLKESEAKTAEAEQLYKRMAADFENYRRRMDREREESVGLGVKKAAEALMPALDDLDRAITYLNPDIAPDKMLESIKLVANRVLQCLDSLGLKKLEAVGETFDPKFHEPVQQIETTEFPDGVVMQELRRGYTLGDRVVRPALVNVASNSTGTVTPAAAANPEELEHTAISQAAEDQRSEESPSEQPTAERTDDGVYDLGDADASDATEA